MYIYASRIYQQVKTYVKITHHLSASFDPTNSARLRTTSGSASRRLNAASQSAIDISCSLRPCKVSRT